MGGQYSTCTTPKSKCYHASSPKSEVVRVAPPELTSKQKQLLTQAWEDMEKKVADVGVITFTGMFKTHPHVEDFFMPFMGLAKTDETYGATLRQHALRVMATVEKCIHRLDEPERMRNVLEQLGTRHSAYNAKVDYVDLLGSQFVMAVRDHSSLWNDEYENAWLSLVRIMTFYIKKGWRDKMQIVAARVRPETRRSGRSSVLDPTSLTSRFSRRSFKTGVAPSPASAGDTPKNAARPAHATSTTTAIARRPDNMALVAYTNPYNTAALTTSSTHHKASAKTTKKPSLTLLPRPEPLTEHVTGEEFLAMCPVLASRDVLVSQTAQCCGCPVPRMSGREKEEKKRDTDIHFAAHMTEAMNQSFPAPVTEVFPAAPITTTFPVTMTSSPMTEAFCAPTRDLEWKTVRHHSVSGYPVHTTHTSTFHSAAHPENLVKSPTRPENLGKSTALPEHLGKSTAQSENLGKSAEAAWSPEGTTPGAAAMSKNGAATQQAFTAKRSSSYQCYCSKLKDLRAASRLPDSFSSPALTIPTSSSSEALVSPSMSSHTPATDSCSRLKDLRAASRLPDSLSSPAFIIPDSLRDEALESPSISSNMSGRDSCNSHRPAVSSHRPNRDSNSQATNSNSALTNSNTPTFRSNTLESPSDPTYCSDISASGNCNKPFVKDPTSDGAKTTFRCSANLQSGPKENGSFDSRSETATCCTHIQNRGDVQTLETEKCTEAENGSRRHNEMIALETENRTHAISMMIENSPVVTLANENSPKLVTLANENCFVSNNTKQEGTVKSENNNLYAMHPAVKLVNDKCSSTDYSSCSSKDGMETNPALKCLNDKCSVTTDYISCNTGMDTNLAVKAVNDKWSTTDHTSRNSEDAMETNRHEAERVEQSVSSSSQIQHGLKNAGECAITKVRVESWSVEACGDAKPSMGCSGCMGLSGELTQSQTQTDSNRTNDSGDYDDDVDRNCFRHQTDSEIQLNDSDDDDVDGEQSRFRHSTVDNCTAPVSQTASEGSSATCSDSYSSQGALSCADIKIVRVASNVNGVSRWNDDQTQGGTSSDAMTHFVTSSDALRHVLTSSDAMTNCVTSSDTMPHCVTSSDTMTHCVTSSDTMKHCVTSSDAMTHAVTSSDPTAPSWSSGKISAQHNGTGRVVNGW